MSNNKATIEFKDGKKIIKHPTGIVVECTTRDFEKVKEMFVFHRNKFDERIAAIDDDLKKMVVKPGEK